MSNVYRIGVNIAMSNGVSPVLGIIARDLLGVHGHVGNLERGMGRLRLAIGGVVAIGAGVALITMFKGPLDEARKLEMAVTKFGNFGLGPARTREAAEFAKAMNIAGSTYVDNMKRMTEAQGVFREAGLGGRAALRGAKLAAPVLGKIDFAGTALDDESHARQNAQAIAMLRFIEMRGGVNSPEKFNAIANAGFKAIQSSGGNINWEQLRQFSARAGVAGQGLSDEALFGKLEPVIGELKGSTAGFALRTAYNRLNGVIKIPNQVAHDLVKNGVWDGSRVEWNSQGGIKRFNGNPLRDGELFSRDPVAFYEKYILPTYGGLSQTERARRNAMTFGSTGGAMFSLIDRQMPAIHHSVEAQRKALGINQAYKAAGGTLNGKIVDLQARYVNLQERLGEAVLPLAVRGLEALIPAINGITKWVAANPGKLMLFAKAAIVVGAALVGFGVVAVGVAAFAAVAAGGWVAIVIAAIGAVIGAVGALVVLNWRKISDFFTGVSTAIGNFFKWVGESPIGRFVGGMFRSVEKNSTLDGLMSNGATRAPAAPGAGASANLRRGDVFLDSHRVGSVLDRRAANLDARADSNRSGWDPSMGPSGGLFGYSY